MIDMLQNATQTTPASTPTTDWTIIIVAIITGVIGIAGGLIGARYTFKKTREWDIDKNKKRNKDEFDKVIHNIGIELTRNIGLLTGNIDLFEKNAKIVFYLDNELWKIAVYSGFLRFLLLFSPKEVYGDLVVTYMMVGMFNQQLRYRERLSVEELKELDPAFIVESKKLKEMMKKSAEILSQLKLDINVFSSVFKEI